MLYVMCIVSFIGIFVLADYLGRMAEKERARSSIKEEALYCLWAAFILGGLTVYLPK